MQGRHLPGSNDPLGCFCAFLTKYKEAFCVFCLFPWPLDCGSKSQSQSQAEATPTVWKEVQNKQRRQQDIGADFNLVYLSCSGSRGSPTILNFCLC